MSMVDAQLTLVFVFLYLQFGMFETMTSAFVDEFPELLRDRKVLFTAVMCFIEFLLGIPFVTRVGRFTSFLFKPLGCWIRFRKN